MQAKNYDAIGHSRIDLEPVADESPAAVSNEGLPRPRVARAPGTHRAIAIS